MKIRYHAQSDAPKLTSGMVADKGAFVDRDGDLNLVDGYSTTLCVSSELQRAIQVDPVTDYDFDGCRLPRPSETFTLIF